jgi:hypothetical protein
MDLPAGFMGLFVTRRIGMAIMQTKKKLPIITAAFVSYDSV